MKRRVISMLLVFCLVFTLIPAMAFADNNAGNTENGETKEVVTVINVFSDVKEDSWYYDSVQYANLNGIFNGTSDTSFSPKGTMTRAMFITVLGRMAGVDIAKYSGKSDFTDVGENAYYAPYVAWAKEYGITSGTTADEFSPNKEINREEMATLFVRYFEAFNVKYDTGANITTVPEDLESIAPYARDAVLKLWKTGLLGGDGKNFNPKAKATRAEAATLCQRTDNAVETWYKEPGVASDRVKIQVENGIILNPEDLPEEKRQQLTKTEIKEQEQQEQQQDDKKQDSSSNSGSNRTRYYQVTFDKVDGTAQTVNLPSSSTYARGTAISQIETPRVENGLFLGWFYDKAGTEAVGIGDTVNRDITLYAKAAEGEMLSPMETPNYITRVDLLAGDYSFKVIGMTDDADISIIDVTNLNSPVAFTRQGENVTVKLEAGQTYKVELLKDGLKYVVKGETQEESIKIFNILVKKEEVTKAELNEGVKEVTSTEIDGLGDEVFQGLYQTDGQGGTRSNDSAGSFTSANVFNTGDVIAVTKGNANLADIKSSEGEVAYIKIKSAASNAGTNTHTYTYEMAELEDVLFMPDTLPIALSSDKDGDDSNGSLTISSEDIVTALSNVNAKDLNVGDYVALYAGSYNGEETDLQEYGKITAYEINNSNQYVITYDKFSTEGDYQSDIESVLDVYYEKDTEVTLTDAEQDALKEGLKNDLKTSGYIENAAMYIAASMLASDNLDEVPDPAKVNELLSQMDLEEFMSSDGLELAKSNVKLNFNWDDFNVDLKINQQLDHLKGKGFKVGVNVPFTIEFGDKFAIDVTAKFVEEVINKQSVNTKRHKIGFLKYDYSINASFTVGNYTGIHFDAVAHTKGDESEATDWLGVKLEQALNIVNQFTEDVSTGNGEMEALAETYAELMDNAGDNFVDLIDQKLFETNGNAFLHVFCWQIKGSFVVSVNMTVAMGMDFEYINQKQYNFSVRAKAKTSTNETIDLVEESYQFDFYIMGTVAVKAGLRLEIYVGLFSLKLDKIGITAEVGAYVQLWGYFTYHKEWSKTAGVSSKSAGAMLVEIGVYIDIRFVAQVFNSDKLTYNPTLYAKQWPLLTMGQRDNVYAFDGEPMTFNVVTTKTLVIPTEVFNMKAMNLKDGEIKTVNRDAKDSGKDEKNFSIAFTNKNFSYEAATNTVTVKQVAGSLEETTEMLITWKKAPLTYNSAPITQSHTIKWTDPEGLRYIAFDSDGGSYIDNLSGGVGAPIKWPANPEKTGYTFAGWYTDKALTKPYSQSTTAIPNMKEGEKGITLYAKWTPALVNYTVETYVQQISGGYSLESTATAQGLAESTTAVSAPDKAGFTKKAVTQETILADGSTVVKVYYDRNKYTITFNAGTGNTADNIEKTLYYNEVISAPTVSKEGHKLTGWNTAASGSGTDLTAETKATGHVTYYPKWETLKYTVTWLDEDGTVLETDENVSFGTEPRFNKANPTKTETVASTYTFAGWTPVVQSVKGDVVYTAVYAATPKQYTINWDAKGGTINTATSDYTNGSVDYDTTIVAPADTTRSDDNGKSYTFAGWNTAANGSGTALASDTKVTGNVTYYAQWTESNITYSITYNGLTGATVSGNPTSYTVETAGITLNNPEKTGYEFAGWTGTDLSEATKTVTIPTGSTGDRTYTATWTPIQYTVTWNAKGGTITAASGTYTNGSVNYDTTIIAPTNPTRANADGKQYEFNGWNTAANGSGTALASSAKVTGNVTYYAQWTESNITYSIKYNGLTGATVSGNPTSYTVETAEITLNNPTKTGYTFAGWTGTELSGATNTVKIQTGSTGDREYTANWTANTYTVTFNVDGGNAVNNITVTYDSAYGSLPTPTKQGHAFNGWYTSASGGTAVTSATVMTQTENHTLYARWVEDNTTYNLWVGGTEVKGGNANNVFVDGKVSFDAATNTLTLNNYTYTGSGVNNTTIADACIGYKGTTALTIKLIGKNSLTFNGNNSYYTSGIYIENSNLTIEGDGSLEVSISGNTVKSGYIRSFCICVASTNSTLTVNGGTIIATGGNINAENVTNYTDGQSIGMTANNIIVNGGSVTAKGGNVSLTAEDGNIARPKSIGISGQVTVNGGSVTASCGDCSNNGTAENGYAMSYKPQALADGVTAQVSQNKDGSNPSTYVSSFASSTFQTYQWFKATSSSPSN